ncbi:Oligoendopeptidase F homolog [uncultured spirochete]|uniref:Oligopeptidase F n=1 Tax=uncultured spirochete TaxID=156406 RepID=A0A3P3XUB0_9SPIR|nr:Oligoendopeptidase F homolog [uncultured spirochete]
MTKTIPERSEISGEHKWNLSSLFKDDAEWERNFAILGAMLPEAEEKKKTDFSASADAFLDTLRAYEQYLILEERLGYYAQLRAAEDEGNSTARGLFARFVGVSSQGQAAWSWLSPTIQALGDDFVAGCLASQTFADYRVFLTKLRRFKPHVLSEAEERLLALQTESAQTAQEAFSVLTNVDLNFGTVETPEGPKPLTQSTFISFMRMQDRSVRKAAYLQFYSHFEAHQNTLGALYAGSVKLDKYQAQVRKYPSARTMALFPDNVAEAAYDNLISTVNENLPILHRYYGLRKEILGLEGLRHYDVYVPLVKEVKASHGYEEAVDIVIEALKPLGEDYVRTLRNGLLGGWVDRYENKGKRSGAFSAGSFIGEPYILMNYKDDVLDDLFTIAHEGGHSMHSWHSARNNPFMCYNYTIFEAEVASTFNEQLVFSYLYDHSSDDREKAFLVATRIDDTLATLFRQTMFAEFEKRAHEIAESGEALTVDVLRKEYRALLEKYFGPEMAFENVSDMEGLRIPHFYNAFYVYKYATGLSASIALSEKVLHGGKAERDAYLDFLKSGGSRFPIESLKLAGVDMSTPEPVEAACRRFAGDVEQLAALLQKK